MKLTDTQMVILSAAANRDDGTVLPLPKSLKINKGSATLVLKSLLKHKFVVESEVANDAAAWREDKSGHRFALTVTPAGLDAIGVDELPEARNEESSSSKKPPRETKPETNITSASPSQKPPARKGTKLAVLVDLLTRNEGATIEEATKATGWQKHSVRGAISGALKKRCGMAVTSNAVDGRGRVYRIAAS